MSQEASSKVVARPSKSMEASLVLFGSGLAVIAICAYAYVHGQFVRERPASESVPKRTRSSQPRPRNSGTAPAAKRAAGQKANHDVMAVVNGRISRDALGPPASSDSRRRARRPGEQAADHAPLPQRNIEVTDGRSMEIDRGQRFKFANNGCKCSSASAASLPNNTNDILWLTLALQKWPINS